MRGGRGGSEALGRTRQESLWALGCAGVRVSGSGVEKAERVPRKSTCSRNVRSLQEVALADGLLSAFGKG